MWAVGGFLFFGSLFYGLTLLFFVRVAIGGGSLDLGWLTGLGLVGGGHCRNWYGYDMVDLARCSKEQSYSFSFFTFSCSFFAVFLVYLSYGSYVYLFFYPSTLTRMEFFPLSFFIFPESWKILLRLILLQ